MLQRQHRHDGQHRRHGAGQDERAARNRLVLERPDRLDRPVRDEARQAVGVLPWDNGEQIGRRPLVIALHVAAPDPSFRAMYRFAVLHVPRHDEVLDVAQVVLVGLAGGEDRHELDERFVYVFAVSDGE